MKLHTPAQSYRNLQLYYLQTSTCIHHRTFQDLISNSLPQCSGGANLLRFSQKLSTYIQLCHPSHVLLESCTTEIQVHIIHLMLWCVLFGITAARDFWEFAANIKPRFSKQSAPSHGYNLSQQAEVRKDYRDVRIGQKGVKQGNISLIADLFIFLLSLM